MAQPGQVHKIYDLKTIGYNDLAKQLDNVAKKFEAIRKAKLSTEGKLAATTDIDDVKKLADEINKLKVEEQELRTERQRMLNEQKAAQIQRQAELARQRQKIAANNAEAGSIAVIRKDIKELNAALILKNQKGTSTIDFRGEILSIDQATAKMKQLTAAEQEFRRQFAKDSTLVGEYTTGIVQAFKQMGLDELVAGQITKSKDRLNGLNTEFDRLQNELKETQLAGKSTETIEKQMIENRNEVIKLDTELARLRTDLRGTGDVGNQISTSIGNGFKALKGQIASFALQFIGISAIINKAQQGISDAKLSSDITTDLQIQLGATADEADRLNESLRSLDTRTTLAGLQQIANVALKAGVAKENIIGVTEAIDKTKVAFGKDFGSIEEGTETFAKLINIFFDDGQITGDRILKIGNSIRALANETVASVPFITDFSGRMAGLKQIANVTLPDILGLGAGFEEFKQSAEVSSTALVKLIPALAKDIDKFAKIAGITNEEFKKLLTETPIEALLKVSEGLVAGKGDVEEFAKTLSDAGLDAGRVTTIIATLGGKADVFRQRIARAGETIQDTGAITDAFNKKNTNLAASMDRLNKVFSDFFSSKTFQTILAAISGLLLLLIGNLPILIGFVTLLTVSWAAQNITLIGLRAQLILYNLGIGANLVLIGALRIANLVYITTMFLLNGAYGLVTKAAALFNITLSKTPLGLILTGVTLLFSAFKAFGKGLSNTNKDLSTYNAQLRINREIAREAAKATSDQRAEAKLLSGVVKDLSVSEETRLATLKKLISLDPVFQKSLVDGKINYKLLSEAIGEYNSNLIRSAELEAAKARQAKEFSKLTDLTDAKQQLEIAVSTGDFSKLEGEILESFADLSKIAPERTKKIAKKAIADLKLALKQQSDVVEAAGKVFSDKLKQIDADKAVPSIVTPAIKSVEVDIEVLKKAIADYDKQIESFRGSQKDLDKLNVDRAKAQAALDKALGKKDKPVSDRGSRLTGEQKDLFKDIDAIRDEQLARLNQALIQQAEFIRKEQDLLIQGEDGKLSIVRGSTKIRIINEERFLFEELALNKKAIEDKLKLLDGSNAEERKQIAELNLEKIRLERDTNNKVFEIRAKQLKDQLDIAVKNAQEQADKIVKDPRVTTSDTERLQAQLDADKKILEAQVLFNIEMDLLEKNRNNLSKKNAEDRARDARNAQQKLNDDALGLGKVQLEEIRAAGEKQTTEYEINYSKLRQAIINNDKLTAKQRRIALEKLARMETVTALSNELAKLTLEFEKIQQLYKDKLVTEQEFLDAELKMRKKAEELQKAQADLKKNKLALPSAQNTQDEFRDKLSGVLGFEEGSDEAKLLGEIIGQTFTLATDAMNSFFDAEQERIQQSLELNLQRLDMEKEQVLARAQSQAEIASIEKQYAAKRRTEERKAHEEMKKSKRSQAKMALAAELANIAVAAASAGAATGPAAPIIIPILYALMAGLALGRYALRVNEINRETFAFGGKPGEVPTKGGKFGGRPHREGGTDFIFKKKKYNAEVKELAVVRTKDAPKQKQFTVTGTQMQIASAANVIGGGIDFKPGAKLKMFETGGFLGQNLEAPVFRSASSTNIFNSNSISKEDLAEITDSMKEIANEQSKRIDRLEVHQVTSTVTRAQRKEVQQSQVGTL